ncbi:MAG: NAD-dependent DNA ligase LigA, partial [Henriciella sp.]|nr:NAD-dependent DNA ligase LigA [Henriciella sp.]
MSDDIAVDDLDEADARAELARLTLEIKLADASYFKEDAPHLSDAVYDQMRRRNLAIETRFPHLKRKDSPSNRVGVAVSEGFGKVEHGLPMLSLDNA